MSGTETNSGTARLEIAAYPLGTGDASVSKEVSAIFDILDNCGLPYEISVMGTIIEGPLDRLLTIARELHDCLFSDSVRRVVTVIKIDEKR